MTSCDQTRTYLQPYADGELDAVTSRAVDEHLGQCAGCRQALDRIEALRTLVRNGAPYYAAPERLAEKIRARVGIEAGAARAPSRGSGAKRGSRENLWRWLQPAALVAVTALVTWIAAVHVSTPSRDDIIASEVIADHSRSMITNHLADVTSSDQHTVKPWLSSKLDFSPPVSDLTTAGFPLVGGRLEYVDNRPVAALVYRHRQHVIDLFIWPDAASAPSSPVRTMTKHGYQLLHWTDGGMRFWAISDLNAADMKSFVETFSRSK